MGELIAAAALKALVEVMQAGGARRLEVRDGERCLVVELGGPPLAPEPRPETPEQLKERLDALLFASAGGG